MTDDEKRRVESGLAVAISKFNEVQYAKSQGDLNGEHPLKHFLRVGIDQGRGPRLNREPLEIRGGIERFFVSETGLFAVLGWLSDEGVRPASFKLYGSDFSVDVPNSSVYRHARPDIEAAVRPGAFDYGFLIVGHTHSESLLKQNLMLGIHSQDGAFQGRCEPELTSDKRFLDTLLVFLKNSQSHCGKEVRLHNFLKSAAGETLMLAFSRYTNEACKDISIYHFGKRDVSRSFITVLFGSIEPVMIQPILFTKAEIDFGEWIYVCNSPEEGMALIRNARLISNLYGVFITVIILGDNVGFGLANNIAIGNAVGSDIYIINPDVYPLTRYRNELRKAITEAELGADLWGGLLFYDDFNLMHSGMQVEQDPFFMCSAGHSRTACASSSQTSIGLLRVEHFDKGVPFEESRWQSSIDVPAISGAMMAFKKDVFMRVGGFSAEYIYGHYEDADLSLRWSETAGRVRINPLLRLVHLEGQGSKARGEQFGSAAVINRHFFSSRYNDAFDATRTKFQSVSSKTNRQIRL